MCDLCIKNILENGATVHYATAEVLQRGQTLRRLNEELDKNFIDPLLVPLVDNFSEIQ